MDSILCPLCVCGTGTQRRGANAIAVVPDDNVMWGGRTLGVRGKAVFIGVTLRSLRPTWHLHTGRNANGRDPAGKCLQLSL